MSLFSWATAPRQSTGARLLDRLENSTQLEDRREALSEFNALTAADDACTATDGADQGTLRYFADKDTLQVCNAEGEWKSAGGGVVDKADNEPCDSEDNAGLLQWDKDAAQLSVCDGQSDADASAYCAVFLVACRMQIMTLTGFWAAKGSKEE